MVAGEPSGRTGHKGVTMIGISGGVLGSTSCPSAIPTSTRRWARFPSASATR